MPPNNLKPHKQKPHCVLIHGFGLCSRILSPLQMALSDFFEVKLLDLPGYGENALDTFPKDLKAMLSYLDHVITEPAFLIGWSLGGMLANYFSNHFPQKTLGVATLASNLKFTESNCWPYGIPSTRMQQFTKQLSENHKKTFQNFLAVCAIGSPEPKKLIQSYQKLAIKPVQSATLNDSLKLLNQLDLRRSIRGTKRPVLSLFGEKDSLVPLNAAHYIKQNYSNLTTVIIPKAGHAPFLSHLSLTLKTLLSFYDEQIAPLPTV